MRVHGVISSRFAAESRVSASPGVISGRFAAESAVSGPFGAISGRFAAEVRGNDQFGAKMTVIDADYSTDYSYIWLEPKFIIMSNFFDAQALCEYTFSKLGPCWHLYTPDNCPIIFTTVEEYKAGMSLFAIAAVMCPKVKVLTFEIMSNHLHATLCGSKEDIEAFFRLFRTMLLKYLRSQGKTLPDSFEMSLRLIESLDDLRNVLVYNNRNGFLVRPEYSPFSYPFGANAYYFNPFAKEYYANCRTKIKTKDLENLAHTHSVRDIEIPIYILDGYICPLCFCDIETGEKLFRDASHYFYSLSRNIEGQKKIAQEIGDRVFYNDDELYSVVATISSKKYGLPPAQLPSDAKVELAKTLHYDYNANNKAIIRMLRLDPNIVNSLFPTRN